MSPRHPYPSRTLAATLLLATAAIVQAEDRIPVSDLKVLLTRAIDHGSARGVLVGAAAAWLREKFGSNAPVEIDVRTLHPLPQPGCSRLEVTTRQRDVVEHGTREDKTLTYAVSYCRDGRFPEPR